jgi:UPF0176 protein
MADSKVKQGESNNVVVLALYKFVHLPDYIELKIPLLQYCKKLNLFGTILLAEEGINGTIAGDRSGIDNLLIYLEQDIRFTAMECKESATDEIPFHRMKVKLKKEIVSMGVATIVPEEKTGTRVKPEDWNTVISDPEVLLIDTRNQYEVDIGTFKNALSPEAETFRDFPEYVDSKLDPEKQKRVAMFCTGGIRCEKASAYLLEKGFEEVYQLDGGILKYLEDIEQADSLWEGECFVFDGRVAVNHELEPGIYAQCYACRRPVSPEQMTSDKYEEGVSCPHCFDTLSEDKRAAVKERQKQVKLAELRHQRHIGASMPGKAAKSRHSSA